MVNLLEKDSININKMKTIFIYYSLSGNGDKVSDYLKTHNIDIRKVNPKKSLPNNMALRILTGGFLAGINYQEELVNFDSDISQYDHVIIGSPIWNGRLSTPINTVLNKIDLVGKKVMFILYSGSGKAPKAVQKITSMYPDAKIIHLTEPLKNNNEVKDKLSNIKS